MENSILFENQQFSNNYSLNVSCDNSPTSFPMHWHTYGEIILAFENNCVFQIQNQKYILQKNDILFIWPSELHSTISAPDKSYMIVQFSGNTLSAYPEMALLQSSILSSRFISNHIFPDITTEIAAYMYQIKEFYFTPRSFNNIRMLLPLYQIFLCLYDHSSEIYDSSQSKSVFSLHTVKTIAAACSYISDNCEKDLTLDDVAQYVNMSRFHFSRFFKEYTKISFSDYLATQRIQRVILLFENPDISIAEAAFQSGFGSISSFNRCFQKQKGCTPSEYRKLLI